MARSRLRDAAIAVVSAVGVLFLPVTGTAGAVEPDGTEMLPESFRTPAVPAAQAAPRGPVCDGDGFSGRRVQAVYVRGDAQADRYAQLVGQFQTFAGQIDDMFVEAATRLGGGVRHVRYVTDAACQAHVANVAVPQAAMATVDSILEALKAKGYNRTDRKYMVWYDKAGCGLGYAGGDDRQDVSNPYNSGPGYAVVGTTCWTWHATAHELLHVLGAVQASAPNATQHGHCWDDEDIMCYDDGGIPNPPGSLVKVCPGAPENQIDCGGDDYFHTDPPAGSYLATHWNVANSAFLMGSAVGPVSGFGGKCADVKNGATANGTAIQLYTCNGTNAQLWAVQQNTLRVLGKCMDVKSGATANGTVVQLYTCNGSAAQVWQPQANGTLLNPKSGRCLDVSNKSTANGTPLIIWDCTAAANQVWRLPA